MNKIIELFGFSADQTNRDWTSIVQNERCPFLDRKCYKVRKSTPDISIGTCTVRYGKNDYPVVICPARLMERSQVFIDCLHLFTKHEPGNQFHLISEVYVPGGKVDFFLISARNGKVYDFIGIELQTLDTTGTVWPERQRLLNGLNVERRDKEEESPKRFGLNWKMTSKTILVQMHHKADIFEHFNKKLVLIVQDKLLNYMEREFNFEHLNIPATIGNSIHFHIYRVEQDIDSHRIALTRRLSTDSDGIRKCLGLRPASRPDFDRVISALERRISSETLFTPVWA